MISGPGVVSPSARPSIICGAGEPVVVLDRALVDVGQHRVGAAEGQQRRLGEEPAHLRQHARPSRRRAPERRSTASQSPRQTPRTWPRRAPGEARRASGVGVSSSISAGAEPACRRAVAAADGELARQRSGRRAQPIEPGAEHDQRERHVEGEDGDEGRRRDAPTASGSSARASRCGRRQCTTIAVTAGLMP